MREILRRDLARLPDFVRSVGVDDPEGAAVVADHLDCLHTLLGASPGPANDVVAALRALLAAWRHGAAPWPHARLTAFVARLETPE